jgi:plasmid stabilization system protein ParE
MTRVELAPEVFEDFDRFLHHLALFEVEDGPERIAEIIRGIDILSHSPLVGRPVKDGKRELVIGQGVRGYVALYRHILDIDIVFILAIRSQREAGYRPGT